MREIYPNFDSLNDLFVNNAKWKDKDYALYSLFLFLEQNPLSFQQDYEALVVYMETISKQFTLPNIVLIKKIFLICITTIRFYHPGPKTCSKLVLGSLKNVFSITFQSIAM